MSDTQIPNSPPALSVVIVCFQMTRQLQRTLLSLAPPYQRMDDAGTVEIIVVDNGSDPPPTEKELTIDGLHLTFYRFPASDPSPVAAMNFGLARAHAPILMAMIDGARMASPGLLTAGIQACNLHDRAVVAFYNYHIGSKPQNQSVHDGYNSSIEDSLLQGIAWPEDGYRLFEIAAPEVGRGWPGPLLESNALCMRRTMWDELGGYDSRFTSPGGGAANPDLFRRAVALPGAQLIKVAGEGTFHQIHGGWITNAQNHKRSHDISVEYHRIRGQPLSLVRKAGWLFDPRTGQVTR